MHINKKHVFKTRFDSAHRWLRLALSGLLVFNHIVGASFALWGILALSATVFSPSAVHAAPQLIAFQGRLSDANNNPRNESVSMTFQICDSLGGDCSAAPGQLWTETQPAVVVSNGIFSAQLGSVTPIPITVFNADTRYLQVTVGAEALAPRQRLLSSPYAMNSERLGGWTSAYFVSTASVSQDVTGSTATWTAGQTFTRALTVSNTNFVLQNGNMGLGVSNPISTLHIASPQDQLILEDSDGAADAKKWLFKADGGDLQLLTANDAWSSWTAALQINRTGTTVNRVAFPNGNVGIGVAVPSSLLDVNGGSITVRGVNAGISIAGSPVLTQASGAAALASTQTFTGSNTFVNPVTASSSVIVMGNIGIGTASPRVKFEVLGSDVYLSNNQFIRAPDNVLTMRPLIGLDTNNAVAIDGNGIGATTGGNLTVGNNLLITGRVASHITFTPDNTLDIGQSGSVRPRNIYAAGNGIFGGNVGIGTTAASSAFDVNNGSITVRGTNAGIDVSGTGATIRLNGYEVMTASTTLDVSGSTQTKTGGLNVAGNVGIGTTGPTSALHVIGTINVGALSGNLVQSKIYQIGGLYLFADSEIGAGFRSNGANTFFTRSTAATMASGVILGWTSGADDNNDVLTGTVDTSIYRNSAGVLRTGGKMIVDGNVGAGTVNPSSKFDVFDGSITVRGANAGLNVNVGAKSANFGLAGSAADNYVQITGNAQNWLYGVNSSNFFGVNDFDQWRLAILPTSGNIGIGTTVPGVKLDVKAGDIRALDGGVTASSITLNGISGADSGAPAGSLAYRSDTGQLKFRTPAGWVAVTTGTIAGGVVDLNSAQTLSNKTLAGSTATITMNFPGSGVWNNSGNVGIGTLAPATKLHLLGADVASTGLLKLQSSADNATARMSFYDVDDFKFGMGWVNNYAVIDLQNNIPFAILGGNVGIGTTAPDAQLEIENATNPRIFLTDTGARTWLVEVTNSKFNIADVTAPADRFTIDTAGNVGVGATGPSSKFDVLDGSITVRGTNAGINVNGYSVMTSSTVLEVSGSTQTKMGGLNIHGGNVGIGTTSPGARLAVRNATDTDYNAGTATNNNLITLTNPVSGANNPVSLAFVTEANGEGFISLVENAANTNADMRFNLRSGGSRADVMTLLSGGNVGVGTVAPSSIFDVNNGSITVRGTNAGISVNGYAVMTSSTVLEVSGSTQTKTGGLNITGNVGIGTTAPISPLHIIMNSDSVGLTLERTSATTGRYNLAIISNGDFSLQETGVAERLRIQKTTGNVGIGTTGPTDILHVKHETNGKGMTIESDAEDAYFTLDSGGGVGDYSNINFSKAGGVAKAQIYMSDSANDDFNIYSVADILLVPTGNVGIGTTGPGAKLDIMSGTDAATTEDLEHIRLTYNDPSLDSNDRWGIRWYQQGAQMGGIDMRWDSNSATLDTVFDGYSGGFQTDRMVIKGNGNVGIGTAGPAAKLHVRMTTGGFGNGFAVENQPGTQKFEIVPGEDTATYFRGHTSYTNGTLNSSGVWGDGSDIAFKENITTLDKYGLNTILSLRPVQYTMKKTGVPQVGFIAQEMRDVIPEVVMGKAVSDGGMGLAISYGQLAPILTRAIMELKAENDLLKARIAALEDRIK